MIQRGDEGIPSMGRKSREGGGAEGEERGGEKREGGGRKTLESLTGNGILPTA
jgi:hypothetical protein